MDSEGTDSAVVVNEIWRAGMGSVSFNRGNGWALGAEESGVGDINDSGQMIGTYEFGTDTRYFITDPNGVGITDSLSILN